LEMRIQLDCATRRVDPLASPEEFGVVMHVGQAVVTQQRKCGVVVGCEWPSHGGREAVGGERAGGPNLPCGRSGDQHAGMGAGRQADQAR
jgi:hypothetical protein